MRILVQFVALVLSCAGLSVQAQDQANTGSAVASAPTPWLTAPSSYPPVMSPSEQSRVLRFGPPLVDRSRFVPLAEEARNISPVKIKYAVRADGYEFCSRITGVPIRFNSQPMACAFWNVKRRECTIITPLQTGFNYIGHELRHCFEGAFHD